MMIRRIAIAMLAATLIISAVAAGPFDPMGADNPLFERRVLVPTICGAVASFGVDYRTAWFAISFVALVVGFVALAELGWGAVALATAFTLMHRIPPFQGIVAGDGVVNPEDMMTIAIACGLVWAANGRRWLWWYWLLAVGALNRESVVFLAPLALLIDRRHGAITLGLCTVLIGLLHIIYPAAPSDAAAANVATLMSYSGWSIVAFVAVMVCMGAIPLATPRNENEFQRGLFFATALFAVANLAFANIVEWRVWGESGVLSAALTASAWGET